MYRFFRPIGKAKKPHPKVVATTSLLLLASVLAALVLFPSTPVTMNEKADPVVWQAITDNKPLMVTVAYYGNINTKGLYVKRIWHFGKLRIIYAEAQPTALKRLVRDPNVVRISAWSKFHLPPYKYVVKSEGVTYNFNIDIKRLFHKANQKWTGKGVTVAIIDTGIDYLHPDFYRNGKTVIKVLVSTLYKTTNNTPVYIVTQGFNKTMMEAVFQLELKIMNETNSTDYVWEDYVGHGTHVAGIIAGQGTASSGKYMGIAPDVDLVIIKAFTDEGYATEETILDALQWIYNNSVKYDIKVLSCSWGSPPESPLPNPTELAMEQLVKDKHIVIFCAAGNEFAVPTTIISPARDPYVFGIGAVDPYTNKLAIFSSIGEPLVPPFNQPDRTKPDFVGAGVNIIAPASEFANFPKDALIKGRGADYVIMSGTSMATPCVAAVYSDFYQYWLSTHGRPPKRSDFVNWEREHGIVYDPLGKDFLTGWGSPVVPAPS